MARGRATRSVVGARTASRCRSTPRTRRSASAANRRSCYEERMSVRAAVVGALLAAQCGVAVWQHLGSTRYFAWAPNDYLMTYNLQVRVGERQLTPEEMSQRYRLSLTELLTPRMRSELNLAADERYVWQDPPSE